MLAYLAMGVGLLALVLLGIRAYAHAETRQLILALKWLALLAAIAGVAWLALSGRLWAALAALPAVAVWLVRLARGLHAVNFMRGQFGRFGSGGANRNRGERPGPDSASSTAMSRDEALKILGLEASASEAEIRAAHHRLLAGLHPDKGGSDYLAQQINRARDTLLDG